MLLVLGGSAWGLWFQGERVRQEERGAYLNKEVRRPWRSRKRHLQKLRAQVDDPKRVPELLSEPDKWRDQLRLARLAWQQAEVGGGQ